MKAWVWAVVLACLSFLPGAKGATSWEPALLEGETFLHDPSTILHLDTRFVVFSTGRGIRSKFSPDLVHWTNGPSVFERTPNWTTNLVPGYRGYAWAPDALQLNARYFLYYAVSTFGKQVSAIGLATTASLNSVPSAWRWEDQGPVLQSTNGSPYNAIDPSVFLDEDSSLWMAFGSFWQGVFLVQLDPKNGLRSHPDALPVRLAWAESIEAPCLTRSGPYYYLFVNWGRCCRGVNSTYEIRVGRSRTVSGPYLDREGKDLIQGGGTLFLESSGRFIGPGHVGILKQGDHFRFSYHFYDALAGGRSRLAIADLTWTSEGWPVAGTLTSK